MHCVLFIKGMFSIHHVGKLYTVQYSGAVRVTGNVATVLMCLTQRAYLDVRSLGAYQKSDSHVGDLEKYGSPFLFAPSYVFLNFYQIIIKPYPDSLCCAL